jgi:hypothetical protein
MTSTEEVNMYDHIGLKVKDVETTVRFYAGALRPLGFVLCSRDESGASFGPPGEPALWLYSAKDPAGPGVHVALRAPDRAGRSIVSTRMVSRRAAATTASPAFGPTTSRPTTPRSCSIPTATT